MLSGLASSAALRLLNHLLRDAPWAQARLAPHANKRVAIVLFPLTLTLSIAADGTFAAADNLLPVDATLTLDPLQAARIIATRDPLAFRNVVIDGDARFAAELGSVLRDLEWDVEADLGRVMGDVAAHRITQTARTLHDWNRNAAASAQASLAEYATEESALIVKRRHTAEFVAAVDALRDDTARLEKRLELLAIRLSPPTSPTH